MKKILLFLILGCTVACSSVYAMKKNPLNNKFNVLATDIEDSNKAPKKLISTPQAKNQKTQKIGSSSVISVDKPSKAPTKQRPIFTQHAKKRMQERKIIPSKVEDTIKYGLKSPDATDPSRYTYIMPPNKGNCALKVVTQPINSTLCLIITTYKKTMNAKTKARIKATEAAMNARAEKKAAKNAKIKALKEPMELVYSQQAQEQMEEQDITQILIEDAIEFGQKSTANDPGTFIYKMQVMNKEGTFALQVVAQEATENNKTIVIKVYYQNIKETCNIEKKVAKEESPKEIAEKQKEETAIESFTQKCVEKTNSFEKSIKQSEKKINTKNYSNFATAGLMLTFVYRIDTLDRATLLMYIQRVRTSMVNKIGSNITKILPLLPLSNVREYGINFFIKPSLIFTAIQTRNFWRIIRTI